MVWQWVTEYHTPLIALVGTIFGGAGLEFIKRWLGKAKERDDTATQLRNELRTDLTALKKEIDEVEKQVTEWKDRYYDVMEKKLTMEQELYKLQWELQQKKAGGLDE